MLQTNTTTDETTTSATAKKTELTDVPGALGDPFSSRSVGSQVDFQLANDRLFRSVVGAFSIFSAEWCKIDANHS